MNYRRMIWIALLVCTFLCAACGPGPSGSASSTATTTHIDFGKLPSAGTVSATIPAIGGTVTDSIYGIAADDTAIWIHNSQRGTVVRVDPTTNRVVATIPVGHGVGDVGLTPGAVWVLNHDDYTVTRIDPSTNQVAATIALPHITGSVHLRISLSSSAGAVWVAREDQDAAWRIDPQTNQAGPEIAPLGGPTWMALVSGSLWVCLRDEFVSSVIRIDPATSNILAHVDLGDGQYACDGLTVANGAIWAELLSTTYDAGLARIDPATNKVTATIFMPLSPAINALAADDHGVWLAKPASGIVRISPTTNQAVSFLSLPGASGIALGAGSVWVVNSDGTLLRITPAN